MLIFNSELGIFDPPDQSMKISDSVQFFVCALYIHGKDFMFVKNFVFLAVSVISSGSFSPTALAILILANSGSFLTCHILLTLLCLPPVHFPRFNPRLLFGSTLKNRPHSSALKTSCNFYLDSVIGINRYVISVMHDFTSPEAVLNVKLFCALICQPIYPML